MHERDVIRLRHMLDAARDALSFVRERTRADLDDDRQLVLALVKAIEIIGEAACRVDLTARAEVPGIPWEDVVGMRHRLVHAYYDIDLDTVWRTTQDDLPPLIVALERVLPAEGGCL